jgi:hypothetical protein
VAELNAPECRRLLRRYGRSQILMVSASFRIRIG